MRLADRIAAGMRADGVESIGWLDNALVDYVHGHTRLRNPHPINQMSAAMAAMERASDLFEKFYRLSMDSRGNERRVRCFRLK